MKFFGLPPHATMEGTPLEVMGLAPTTVVREDAPGSPIVGPHRPQPPQFDYTPEEQAIIEQRLADLGYLE